MKKWNLSAFSGLLLMMLLVLAACSTENDTSDKGLEKDVAGENKDSSSASGGDSDTPKVGGKFTFAIPADPPTLDPHLSPSAWTHYYMGLVYNKLLTLEEKDGEYHLAPDLAESWETSDDGLTYTFHLREAYWQDVAPVNGRQFVADDVIATMNRIQTLPGHQSSYLDALEKIEAPDDKTVVFTLSEPFAPFINYMANHFMWILPKEGIDGEFDLSATAVGTGPFILEDRQENVKATFIRNPNFFEEGKPYLDQVDILTMADPAASQAAFRTGSLEVMLNEMSPEEIASLVKSNPDTVVNKVVSSGTIELFMNQTRKPFDDIRVRKAVSMAVDRKNAVTQIFGDGEIGGPVNPSMGDWALPLEEREELQPYDVEEAKRLLAEAGYPDGFDIKMMATSQYGEQLLRLAQWVVADLGEIGINAELDMQEVANMFGNLWPNLDYEIGINYQTPFQESDEWLRAQHHSEASRNWFGINDPKLDVMLDEQRSVLDIPKRKEMVHDIQRYILEEVSNPIALVTPHGLSPIPPYVKNWDVHPSFGWMHMKNVWLDK